jgi:hypothetical protein
MPLRKPAVMRKEVEVSEVIDCLCREEQRLKKAGAFGEAAGIRDAVVLVLRIADAEETQAHPIDPSEPT